MFTSPSHASVALLALAAAVGIGSSVALAGSASPAVAPLAVEHSLAIVGVDFVANDPDAVLLVDDNGEPWVETVTVRSN